MKKLVIVDDEFMVLRGLTKIFDWASLGIEVVGTFPNGSLALEYLKQNQVDIVITDMTMPVMDGITFLQNAIGLGLDFQFIIISGYQDFDYVLEGLRLGAENYLLKPIDEAELLKNVMQVLDKIQIKDDLIKSKDAFVKDTIYRWVNNDIDYLELQKNLKDISHIEDGNLYTVAVLSPTGGHKSKSLQFLHNFEQKLKFRDESGNYVVIIDHQVSDHLEFVKALTEMSGEMFKLGMGETTSHCMDIHLSYEHAKAMIELLEFYDVSKSKSIYQKFDTTISLKEYSNSLGLRDLKTINKSIISVFEDLENQNSNPAYVRQITFMMYMDLRRAFEKSKDKKSEMTIENIMNSTTKVELFQILENSIQELREDVGTLLYNANIQEVLKIVDRDYNQDLNLKTVSDALHLNTVYLGQLIKKETGKTFSQYLNVYRIRQAQKLLVTTDLNINEITFAVGYSSSGYFYKNFKRICGVSPSDFRENFTTGYEPLTDI